MNEPSLRPLRVGYALIGCLAFGALRSVSLFLEAAWRGLPPGHYPVWALVGLAFLVWLSWWPFLPLMDRAVRRFPPWGTQWAPHVVLHLGLFATVLVLRGLLRMGLEGGWLLAAGHNILDDMSFGEHMGMMIVGEGFGDLTLYCMILAGLAAYATHQRQSVHQAALARAERVAIEAQLHALEGQLNPHFFFNALNAISAYVERDPRTARRLMADLADVLRFTLHHAHGEVTLADELDVLERYLDLERARYDDEIRIEVSVAPGLLDTRVPALLLQPLVENAIRHGLRARVGRGHLRVRGERQEDRVHLSVEDDGVGLPEGWVLEAQRGVGLRNTRERLRLLYGAHQSLDVTPRADGGVCVDLWLPHASKKAAQDCSPLQASPTP